MEGYLLSLFERPDPNLAKKLAECIQSFLTDMKQDTKQDMKPDMRQDMTMCWCVVGHSHRFLPIEGQGYVKTDAMYKSTHSHNGLPVHMYQDLAQHNRVITFSIGEIGTIYHHEANKEWFIVKKIEYNNYVTFTIIDRQGSPIETRREHCTNTDLRIFIGCWLL
jgi:hypothetical protein